ncbi:hypothetical protein FCE95_07655 [Luteimonas gilva]|uniref:Uncharacterized protein n=1 Tax=Luteimonas gilva TaxID=2572684 RepID=A0A4U5JVZ0_9GAMM|nr:hypothetical protein [Luteimonas gilva]TKR34130.1 hypothetical protein FCE95_07655 [Luteimonas gilva]
MQDILPPSLISMLRDRYLAGVADAEAFFDQNRGDEDSLTGALGQALAMREPILFTGPEGIYSVRVSYMKLRGRGPNAPEKRLGADGIFQIEVANNRGDVIRRKGLPFQAKTNWRGKSSTLLRQAELMEQMSPGGLVIDYSSNGYKACLANNVVVVGGHRSGVNHSGAMRPLGQVLSRDFLNCTIGTRDLYFDPEREIYSQFEGAGGLNLITTQVTKVGQDEA